MNDKQRHELWKALWRVVNSPDYGTLEELTDALLEVVVDSLLNQDSKKEEG